jgi:hypothetical protein
VLPVLLTPARVLLTASAGALLRPFGLGLGGSFLRRRLLGGPAVPFPACPLMPAMIALLAAAMTLLAGAALWLILLPVLRLRLSRTFPRLALAVLAWAMTALASFLSPLRSMRPAMMRPSAARTFGAFEFRLRPAEAPDFLELGFGPGLAFGLCRFSLSRRRHLSRENRIGSLHLRGCCSLPSAGGSIRLRWRGFSLSPSRHSLFPGRLDGRLHGLFRS